jgi:hypothetical protein
MYVCIFACTNEMNFPSDERTARLINARGTLHNMHPVMLKKRRVCSTDKGVHSPVLYVNYGTCMPCKCVSVCFVIVFPCVPRAHDHLEH